MRIDLKSVIAALAATGALLAPAWGQPLEPTRMTSWITDWELVSGERDSAKFLEYRDIGGLTGTYMQDYRNGPLFHSILWDSIGQGDQRLVISGRRQGDWYGQFYYDVLPHRFAFDALSLYRGLGTGNLEIPDAIQANLQASTSSADSADRLQAALDSDGFLTDVWLKRQTVGGKLELVASEPLNVRVEWQNEQREGTRPFFGSFGFNNTVETLEPIDYNTEDIRLIAEYAGGNKFLSASYYNQRFENDIDAMIWDNPFRITDSTSGNAYLQTYQSGPESGLLDLYPDNRFHNWTLSGGLSQFGGRTGALSGTLSWGKMKQNDNLYAYTTNTAVTGNDDGVAFDPTNPANLPVQKIDAEVETRLYDLNYSIRPWERSSLKARYRMYEYQNNTPSYQFPGWVRADTAWQEGIIISEPFSHKRTSYSLDWQYDLARRTYLTLGYRNDQMEREHREVSDSDEDTFSVEVDWKSMQWLSLHLGYEHGNRRYDSYDFTVPFPGNPNPPQLPFLRKYDEANRDRNALSLIATAVPTENFAITGSVGWSDNDYPDSPYGLRAAKQYHYSLDADYAFMDGGSIYAFAARELYKNDQTSREWTSPAQATPPTSNLDWNALSEDNVTTLGGGIVIPIQPRKLDVRLSGWRTKGNGSVQFSGPLADTRSSLDYWNVDDTTQTYLDAQVRYTVSRTLGLTLGYAWQGFDIDDFSQDSPNVVTNPAGNYNGGLLMGTMPQSFNAHILYGRVYYSF